MLKLLSLNYKLSYFKPNQEYNLDFPRCSNAVITLFPRAGFLYVKWDASVLQNQR